MIYQVIIDMTLVLPKIKNLKIKLGQFGRESLMLTIDADNPDNACYLAFKTFCDHMLEHSPTPEVKNLLKDLKNDFIVVGLMS